MASRLLHQSIVIPIRPPHRLTTQDASFLYGESRTAPLHFGGFATFAGAIDYRRLLEHMEARLPLVPRFRERLVLAPFNLAHPAMEPDPDFKLTNHVQLHELPLDSNDDAVMQAVMRVFEPALSRQRPLWELHLFRGLSGRRSALLWKIHHAIVDGVSWVQVLNAILACTADEPAPIVDGKASKPPVYAAPLAQAALDLTEMRLDAARRIVTGLPDATQAIDSAMSTLRSLIRPTIAAPWNRSFVSEKRMLARMRYRLEDVRTIRRAFGATLNDLAVAILAEGAARYLRHHGIDAGGRSMRIGCPVSVRSLSEMSKLGNRVSMMVVETAAQPGDPIERLRAVAAETSRIKASHESEALDVLAAAADFIPPRLMALASPLGTGLIDAASGLAARAPAIARRLAATIPLPINFIATNVHGPTGPRYVAGHEMLDYAGMIPLGGNLGYGAVICTYNHQLSLGLMAEPRLMPDVELMKSCVGEAFDELMHAAEEARPHPLEHPQAA